MTFLPGVPVISIWVEGTAKPAGSKKAIPIYRGSGMRRTFTGHAAVVDDCKGSRNWKNVVAYSAKGQFRGPLLTGAIMARFEFFLRRPEDDYRTGKAKAYLRDSARPWPTVKPDVLKLTRAVEDALTGIIYVDDSQIVHEEIKKEYVLFRGAFTGVAITIQQIPSP